jgi:hypothetical protein
LLGANIRVLIRQELKYINLSPSGIIVSVVAARFGPTEGVSGSLDPSGAGPASPDPSGAGPASPDPLESELLSNRSEGPERGPRHLNHHGCVPLT